MSGGTLISFSGNSLGCRRNQAGQIYHSGVLNKVSTEAPRDEISAGLNSERIWRELCSGSRVWISATLFWRHFFWTTLVSTWDNDRRYAYIRMPRYDEPWKHESCLQLELWYDDSVKRWNLSFAGKQRCNKLRLHMLSQMHLRTHTIVHQAPRIKNDLTYRIIACSELKRI